MAGRIRRLHIRPMNGEEQNVAAHTWGVVMILLDLFPDVSRDAIIFALRHDVPEVVTGDIPANVKWDNAELEEALEKREKEFLEAMGWKTKHAGVPSWDRESLYIKIADRVELLFFCLEQMYMGNWLLTDVYVNVRDKIAEDVSLLDKEYMPIIISYIDSYSEYLAKNFSQKAILSHDGLSIS
tara:strand:+ start:12189 stop:12737 length:549 start_codon:yes stop_codon:yes gene_type:complete